VNASKNVKMLQHRHTQTLLATRGQKHCHDYHRNIVRPFNKNYARRIRAVYASNDDDEQQPTEEEEDSLRSWKVISEAPSSSSQQQQQQQLPASSFYSSSEFAVEEINSINSKSGGIPIISPNTKRRTQMAFTCNKW